MPILDDKSQERAYRKDPKSPWEGERVSNSAGPGRVGDRERVVEEGYSKFKGFVRILFPL